MARATGKSPGKELSELSTRVGELEDRVEDLAASLSETDNYARGGAGKAVELEQQVEILEARLDAVERVLRRRGLARTDSDGYLTP